MDTGVDDTIDLYVVNGGAGIRAGILLKEDLSKDGPVFTVWLTGSS
jgi:hypothetical protein